MSAAVEFDAMIERAGYHSIKWTRCTPSMLPMWIADMDFQAPPAVRKALRRQLDHGVLGYPDLGESLSQATCAWLWQQHQWAVQPDWLVWLPGVVPALHQAVELVC